MFDPNTFKEAVGDVRGRITFGKLSTRQRYLRFHGKGNPPDEITADEYVALRASDGKANAGQELVVEVDGKEFNERQQFIYSRKVSIGNNADWTTLQQSAIAVFGSMDKFAEALKGGAYVEIEDVPSKRSSYNTPKFVARFADVKTCAAAWAAKYAKKELSNGKAPEAILKQARGLFEMVKDRKQFGQLVNTDPALMQYATEILQIADTQWK